MTLEALKEDIKAIFNNPIESIRPYSDGVNISTSITFKKEKGTIQYKFSTIFFEEEKIKSTNFVRDDIFFNIGEDDYGKVLYASLSDDKKLINVSYKDNEDKFGKFQVER